MKYKIMERESFQVVGIKRELSCENGENLSEIPKMWADVHADGTNNLFIQVE
jgi:AraC family transcriptional regulator